jgi:hypothetical protein
MTDNRLAELKTVECRECGESEIKHILDAPGGDERFMTVFVCGHRDLFSQAEPR